MVVAYSKTDLLIQKGVTIPNPESVYIDESIDIDRVSGHGVTLYSGTKLIGPATLVSPNVTLGYEAPVTVVDTLVGPETRLNGGFFQNTVFAGFNTVGSGAHFRAGTILEEYANAAHTVGLKQTILFPFVTLGSLINFCDCLMAGGTSRKDHSEVGSSFIHFNYTPNQDKATASILGNVHQGVMLNQKPIFLGGQGGLVGPRRVAFGCVTAAGTILRRDEERPDRLLIGGSLKSGSLKRFPGVYSTIKPIFENNCRYIAGLISLMQWYTRIRSLFSHDFLSECLLSGMKKTLQMGINERIKRLDDFCLKLKASKNLVKERSKEEPVTLINQHDYYIKTWADFRSNRFHRLLPQNQPSPPDNLIEEINNGIQTLGRNYVGVIQSLSPAAASAGSFWLESIENNLMESILN